MLVSGLVNVDRHLDPPGLAYDFERHRDTSQHVFAIRMGLPSYQIPRNSKSLITPLVMVLYFSRKEEVMEIDSCRLLNFSFSYPANFVQNL